MSENVNSDLTGPRSVETDFRRWRRTVGIDRRRATEIFGVTLRTIGLWDRGFDSRGRLTGPGVAERRIMSLLQEKGVVPEPWSVNAPAMARG